MSKSNQALEENKVRITGQVNSLKTQIVRMESKIATLTSKLQVYNRIYSNVKIIFKCIFLQLKESECRGLRSEKESLIRTAKEAAQGSSGSEIRLARSREEIQSLRSSLNTTKAQERVNNLF